jgi:type IV secretory pathway TrbD component
MRKVSKRSCGESKNTHFIFNKVSFENFILSGIIAVTVTTTCRVLRLWIEERLPLWSVAANILNKQTRTDDKVWSSSLKVGKRANNSENWPCY